MGRWMLALALSLAGCDGDPGVAVQDGAIVDAAPRLDVHVPDMSPDAARLPGPDLAPPDPDAGWPAAFDLVALIDAYEAGELEVGAARAALRAAPDEALIEAVGPTLDRPALVGPGVTLRVEASLTVAEGALLVLAPGARLELAPGVAVTVEGRLYAMGAADAPAIIEGEGYDTVELRGGPNALVETRLAGGDRLLTVAHPAGVRTRVVGSDFDHWVDVALDMPRADGIELRDSRFGLQSPPDEGGEMVRTRGGGGIVIAGSTFGPRRGYRDAIDLQDCRGAWPILIGNSFFEGEDDAIDLDRCSAFVVGNHIRDFRPLDIDRPRAGINGGGITGDGDIDIIIANNVIERCYHGIGFKNGARPVMINNTIVDGHIGVSLYQSAVGNPMPHGVMINNLLAGNRHLVTGAPQDIVLNGRWWPTYNQQDAVQATLEADHNTIASGGEVPPGMGNDGMDPLIERPDGWPVPGVGSPALDSGRGVGLPEAAIDWLRTDLLGTSRSLGDGGFVDVDRGAIER